MSDSSQNVLILGGGVAGLAAADYLEDCGVAVHLIEKTSRLGGKAREWACMATTKCRHCGACLSIELADRVARGEHVSTLLESRVTRLDKQNGRFQATVDGHTSGDLDVDAILVATGMSVFDPTGREDLGYGRHANVLTTGELNTILRRDALAARLDGNARPAIAFIQCVGSRSRVEGRDYCSRVCCRTAMRQANKIRHLLPEAAVTIFNIDLQATGKEFRAQVAAANQHVEFCQGTPAKITADAQNGRLTVFHEDGPASRTSRQFDLVVLAVGILPASATGEIAGMLDIETDSWGFLDSSGTRLPAGIYTAGVSRGPAGILTAIGQGRAAAGEIAEFLNCRPQKEKSRIAVFGGDAAADRVAAALTARGFPTAMIAAADYPLAPAPSRELYPSARLERVSGTAGHFTLQVTTPQGTQTISAGALVMAEPPRRTPVTAASGQVVVSLSELLDRCSTKNALPERILFWLDHSGPERRDVVATLMALVPDLVAAGKQIIILMEKMLVDYPNGQRIYDSIRGLGVKLLRVSGQQQVALQLQKNAAVFEIDEATLPGLTITVECDLVVIPEQVTVSANGRHIASRLGQPLDAEGFLQSANVLHRNVGSPRRGIFYAGLTHDEGDLEAEIKEIAAALERPDTFLDQNGSAPQINKHVCVRCLTCVRICPHSAIVLHNHYQPEIEPSACFGCQLCVSICPALAIETAPVPKPVSARKVVFACERSAGLAAREIDLPDAATIVKMPCACSVDANRILQTLAGGADQVMIAACHAGNCRSLKGAAFAAAGTRQLIDEADLPAERLRCVPVAANEPARLEKLLKSTESAEEVE